MKKRLLTFPVILAGCASLQPTPLAGERDVIVYPQFARHTQMVVDVLPMIATLDIIPYIQGTDGTFSPISSITGLPVEPGAPELLKLTQASPSITADKPFVFRRFKFGKKYRIYGKAYDASNNLISQDTSSYIELNTNWEERPSTTNLPIYIMTSAPAATMSFKIYTDERSDFLKTSLLLLPSYTVITADQTSRRNPEVLLSNLQGNTKYNFRVEIYKNGVLKNNYSSDFYIGNENEPASMSIAAMSGYGYASLAGISGSAGFADGAGVSAQFYYPKGVALGPDGSLYVADECNNRIRKVSSTGNVTTFVGSTSGYQDGTGTAALFNYPRGVGFDHSGNLFVADAANHCIRKVTSTGEVTTFAGTPKTSGAQNGDGTSARFNYPSAIAIDAQDNLYVMDTNNLQVRKITAQGTVTTLAGSTYGYEDGTGTAAKFSYTYGLAVDASGNIYVPDNGNHRIRKIDPNGVVTTIAGSGLPFINDGVGTSAETKSPVAAACDSFGNIYFSDSNGIRKICPDSNYVKSVYSNNCYGIAVDSTGKVYAAQTDYHRIGTYQ